MICLALPCKTSDWTQRYKDRGSVTSVLTDSESLRFHRAFYRLWSYQAIFGPDWADTNQSAEDEEIEEMLSQSRKFLDVIDDSVEECEFAAICRFMIETIHWLWVSKNPAVWQSRAYSSQSRRAHNTCTHIAMPLLPPL